MGRLRELFRFHSGPVRSDDMDVNSSSVLALARTPQGKRMIRYSMVSVVSVAVSQIVLFTTYTVGRVASAVVCNFIACSVATVPSYYLNRTWAWGKAGKSHLWKEVMPFWGLAFLGLGLSLWAVDYAESHAHHFTNNHFWVGIIVNAAALSAFGVLWIGKFVIFNKVLFAHHPETMEDAPALDGRTGLPT